MHEHDSLLKRVPGHLFSFEEKVFGLFTLPQLLCDLGAGAGILALTSSFPLTTRLLIGIALALPVLVLVHGKIHGYTFLRWLYLYGHSLSIPRHTTYRSFQAEQKAQRRSQPSIQTTWIRFNRLEHGIAGYSTSKGGEYYWIILEITGRNIRYLPRTEQIQLFKRFETFLAGLDFRLQFISHTEQVHPRAFAPLRIQQKALQHVSNTPQLARLQQASLHFQQQHIPNCTLTRHFVILSVSTQEETIRTAQGAQQGAFFTVFRLPGRTHTPSISKAHLLNQLRIRYSVVKKLFQQLEVQITLLSDQEILRVFASSLVPGATNVEPGILAKHLPHTTTKDHSLADLLAPKRITIHPHMLEVEGQSGKRYQRYFTVVTYGHELACGWVNELMELGLPMHVSTTFEPLDTRIILHRLEQHLVKLESKRFADQKALRITKADQHIEAEQIQHITRELAERRLKIFVVSMTIGIHASSLERLEQRSHYLLSHLRQRQLQVLPGLRQQDVLWQASLPTCPAVLLDHAINLPGDVCSTFLHATSGVVGTPTGVFLGFTGSGFSRRPVYFNPWSAEKKIPNPHIVVVGESGMGKSWLGKTFVTGLAGMGIADIVVLDRDDDYLPLHNALAGESQRYNLAQSCPINFFDLPFGPEHVDPDAPIDLLSEFLDNHLMVALALIVTDAENGNAKLSKIEEAYLMQVARHTYAAKGITSEAIRHDPATLLIPAPTLADFLVTMKQTKASSEEMRLSLLERLEKALYLFPGETRISISKPMTIFSICDLDEKWYPLMTFVVQNFLYRHRALRQDERYLAYLVEEASYMLKHPAGRRYLEAGSRGFRKLGIAQITLSQHPGDFLEEGAVILSNAGTAFFLGMQPNAVAKLNLSPELERVLTEAVPGQAVMRCGNEFAALTIASIPQIRHLLTTDPQERRTLRKHHDHTRKGQTDA
ncbi:type IV secretory pathway VirB4 component [Thermosporothrix hazakensis]|jgi:hypothetical protein|uniref:Type IV secretory pathway VirB4 component n=1 Tax=Thermosporothrix hazakensis TaxID=644383 RepID=A0A326U2U5_THEHA|nr:DUF87 domain-containing protein [Thermosporothrix hazakensis]PZW25360.1 type IV secretory pathway VirB4 component [Thermosporothrix hazakensis]GCE50592.1 hypothetical protein KTH_54610 [Thermosporothrix hazakensis]